MVDYIITPQICLSTCKKFKVITCKDAIETFHLETCIGERCKPFDNSILSLNFVISYFPEQAEKIDVSVKDNSAEYEVNTVTREKFKMSKLPKKF